MGLVFKQGYACPVPGNMNLLYRMRCDRATLALLLFLGGLLFWLSPSAAWAGSLSDREFPDWKGKPVLSEARGDLVYPEWMAGKWDVTSTLVEARAPLAPDLVTPGFEGNLGYLDQPISFQVQFREMKSAPISSVLSPVPRLKLEEKLYPEIVADRSGNGLNIAKAILGDRGVISVQVDPNNPNRQITKFPGDRSLISVVTSRGTETPSPGEFIASEIAQQIFEGESTLYLNEVETTTAYRQEKQGIVGNQMTAIYLSPQDPNYFKAAGNPVALYRYQLTLQQVTNQGD
ncbi:MULTISPECIES: DUF6816 family protein [Limnospira]|uniref:DUF6816 family protein n=1 Tax=Limnospira TaxID=2596745 RepID=UPI0002803F09|nr:hypothetical protein SPLC1_S370280 [Arthrospira platensis C1]QJB25589.1 hypothetical protein HFV01_07045 [Limnospira fusiformis SAG 85.79]UWU47407.1 hypothetical protein APLC1_2168 [Arthrospira platensis C1]